MVSPSPAKIELLRNAISCETCSTNRSGWSSWRPSVPALLVGHFDLIARLQAAQFCDSVVVGNEMELLTLDVLD